MIAADLLVPGVSGGGRLRRMSAYCINYVQVFGSTEPLAAFFTAAAAAVATRVAPSLPDPGLLNAGRELREEAGKCISYAHLYGGEAAANLTAFFTDCAAKAGGGVVTPPTNYIMVGTGVGAPSSGLVNSAGYKQFNSSYILANGAGTTIQDGTISLRFVNAHINPNGNGTMIAGPALTLRAGISPKVAAGTTPNGTRFALTFNGGQTSVTLAPGEAIWSDPITFGSNIAAGERWRCVVNLDYATAPGMYPNSNLNTTSAGSNTEDLNEGAVSGLANKSLSGLPASRIASKKMFMPSSIRGVPVSGSRVRKGLCIIGDSITSGADDTQTDSVVGFAQRGVASPNSTVANTWSVASTEGYAYVTMPRGSAARGFTLEAAHNASAALCFLNVNDIRSGQTSAQIRANMQTLKEDLAAMGVSKLIVATCFTTTTAANGDPGGGIWTRLNQLNADIIANNGVGDGYFDINAITRDSSNANVWKSGYVANDGVHPLPSMHALLATALGSFLDSLPV